MTTSLPPSWTAAGLAPASIRELEFPTANFSRGYERHAVDEFVTQVATVIDTLGSELDASAGEIERLQQRVLDGPQGDEVVQAVNIISAAQRTADSTVAEADSYSARVMAEARAAYEDARTRGAQLEQEAEERVRALSTAAQLHQEELDKQTAYLRTLRDATRTQMQKFLEGMLDHVAEEYGRAHPFAAAASTEKSPDDQDEPARPNGTPDMRAAHEAAAPNSPNGLPVASVS